MSDFNSNWRRRAECDFTFTAFFIGSSYKTRSVCSLQSVHQCEFKIFLVFRSMINLKVAVKYLKVRIIKTKIVSISIFDRRAAIPVRTVLEDIYTEVCSNIALTYSYWYVWCYMLCFSCRDRFSQAILGHSVSSTEHTPIYTPLCQRKVKEIPFASLQFCVENRRPPIENSNIFSP